MSYPIIKTPRGTVVIGKDFKAELTWNTAKFSGPGAGHRGGQSWQGRYSRAQWFVDNEILRLCDPYIPFQTGMLIKSGILGTKIGSGTVKWIAPYARYMYYGMSKKGNPLKYNDAPMRGAFWFERMKAVNGRAIIAGARRMAGGG